jgi:hypothetical protein
MYELNENEVQAKKILWDVDKSQDPRSSTVLPLRYLNMSANGLIGYV